MSDLGSGDGEEGVGDGIKYLSMILSWANLGTLRAPAQDEPRFFPVSFFFFSKKVTKDEFLMDGFKPSIQIWSMMGEEHRRSNESRWVIW